MAENSSDDENESSYHPNDDNDEQVSQEDLIADDSDDGQKGKMSSVAKEFVRPPIIVIHKGKDIDVTKKHQDAR